MGRGKLRVLMGFGADKSIVGVGDRCRARFVWFGVSCGMSEGGKRMGKKRGQAMNAKKSCYHQPEIALRKLAPRTWPILNPFHFFGRSKKKIK